MAPPSVSAQQDGPETRVGQDAEKPSSISPEEIKRAIRILENDAEQKDLLRDLKALAAADASSSSSAPSSEPSGWSWRTPASWFSSGTKKLQSMLGSREGRILLLQRFALSVALFLLAAGGWRFLGRKLARSRITSRTTLALIKLLSAALVLFFLLLIWGVDISALASSPVAKRLFRSALVILLVIALGTAVWEFFNAYIRKQYERLDSAAMSERRLQTLLPLLRNVARIVIIMVCLLIILSELGLNIAPLLAGAGIIGLAVGFGAQTLVKDLINGFLVLAENAINVGDWVILGGHDGQVESLSIRNVRVRDIYGNVNIVPWSSVETVVNQTMGHGWAVVEPGVAYRENIDEVIGVVKEVAAEMRRDPALNQDILSDLQILGLIELGDSAVIVRTRFKTTPFRRWFLERDFRRRLKNRFDELGIEIPYPHSTVYFGENKQGHASPARIEVLQRGDQGEDTNGDTE
ncbi:MAG: mechanosensitive ion channel [Desulfohalobiaceae bacterium]|nr:mechanosensitive ion channel [Desulfohalobiaceae bacterium]